MNELIFIRENFNVVSVCFLKNKKLSSKTYNWYLPYRHLDKFKIDDEVIIKSNSLIKKVKIINLTYHPHADRLYKKFPVFQNQPSWQIRLICRILDKEGINYTRERCFKELKNIDGKQLRVDISFKKENQWYFIEYHGTHHYFRCGATKKRFISIRRIMEIKRIWCIENKIKYLEIPFYRQNEISEILATFLN